MNVQLVVIVGLKKMKMMHLLMDLEAIVVLAVSVEVVLQLIVEMIVEMSMVQVVLKVIVLVKKMKKKMKIQNILLKQKVQILWCCLKFHYTNYIIFLLTIFLLTKISFLEMGNMYCCKH